MNVSRCPAVLSIEDFSGGKMKNISEQIIVGSDRMSGDVVDLSDDMLAGIDKSSGLEQ